MTRSKYRRSANLNGPLRLSRSGSWTWVAMFLSRNSSDLLMQALVSSSNAQSNGNLVNYLQPGFLDYGSPNFNLASDYFHGNDLPLPSANKVFRWIAMLKKHCIWISRCICGCLYRRGAYLRKHQRTCTRFENFIGSMEQKVEDFVARDRNLASELETFDTNPRT